MAVNVIGNHSRAYLGHGINGNGIQNVPVGMGWTQGSASEAGDVWLLQLTTVVTGDINQGIFFQSEAGATVEFTLFNPGIAGEHDAVSQASVMYDPTVLTVPAGGEIVEAPSIFTIAKITFTAPGTVYVAVR